MVGTPTHFLIHDLTLERLESQPEEILQTARAHMQAEPLYAALGALGVNLFDFIPVTATADASGRRLDAQAAIWRAIFAILVDPIEPDDPNRNVLAVLRRIRTLISDISSAADDESLTQLAALRDRLEEFEEDREVLDAFLPRLGNPALFQPVSTLITTAARPSAAVDTGDPIPDPEDWGLRDHVSAFRTGQFAERLVQRGRERFDADGDRRFLAYALGFRTAYCAKAVGSPFVNSIVGSVPRLHWWRARWIERFVDAWAWGFMTRTGPHRWRTAHRISKIGAGCAMRTCINGSAWARWRIMIRWP